ncbi:MAG TPA: hypothetical protein VIM11_16135 [Tepidisphaeraceae bacterium]|jgi:hypothetical protein
MEVKRDGIGWAFREVMDAAGMTVLTCNGMKRNATPGEASRPRIELLQVY